MNTSSPAASTPPARLTAFLGDTLCARGSLETILPALRAVRDDPRPLVVFDDGRGAVVDLDLRDLPSAIPVPSGSATVAVVTTPSAPGRGRPKLGVVAREVTLLPRHWEWLATQPGGASVTLRRLVDEARRATQGADAQRARVERVYRVLVVLCGDRPGFEEASRALFAGDFARFNTLAAVWPTDVRIYLDELGAAG
jgi:hypothetical protein